jgi:hypothetical protein
LWLALVALGGCGSDEIGRDIGKDIYSGYLIVGFEVQAFAADGAHERWWIEGGAFPCLQSGPTEGYRSSGPIAYVVVQGDLEPGRDGYAQTLQVKNVFGCWRVKNDEQVSIEF